MRIPAFVKTIRFRLALWYSVTFLMLFVLLSVGINLAVDYTSIHQMSFGKTIILKTLLYSIAMAVIFFLMAGIIFTSGLSPVDVNGFQEFFKTVEVSPHFYLGITAFFIMSTLMINFIALVSKKFGPGQMFLRIWICRSA